MARRRKPAKPEPFGRRRDGTIKPGFYLDCSGKMRTARQLARGAGPGRRRRRSPRPPRPTQLGLL